MKEKFVFKDSDAEENGFGWDVRKAVDQAYLVEGYDDWSTDWKYRTNARTYAERLRRYCEEVELDICGDTERLGKVIGIYYSLCRAFKPLEIALIDAIGFNNAFSIPLTNAEFYKVVDYAENTGGGNRSYSVTKGRFYTPMRILKECGLDVDEVGIGVNEKRRMVHERTLEHKTKRDGRIRELILAGLEDDEIVKRMVEAGFSDHPRTFLRNAVKLRNKMNL